MKRIVNKFSQETKEIPYTFKYVKVFRNWWVVLFDWIGIIQKKHILILRFRNKCLIRANSTARNVAINMAIHNEYIIDEKKEFDKYKNIIDMVGHMVFSLFILAGFARMQKCSLLNLKRRIMKC